MNENPSALVELRIDEEENLRELGRWFAIWGLNEEISEPQLLWAWLERLVQ